MEYYNPFVEVLDYVDAGTFSYATIEEHLLWLGYPVNEHILYWCRPDKTILDGMVRIRGDEDVHHMIKASSLHKVLAIMVDHTYFISNFRGDLILTVPTVQSSVIMDRSNVVPSSATSSHSLISVIVEDRISEVAANNTEAENLLGNGTETKNLLTDGATADNLLTDGGAAENFLTDGAEDVVL